MEDKNVIQLIALSIAGMSTWETIAFEDESGVGPG